MRTKYVVGEVRAVLGGTTLVAVTFPESIGHDWVGRRLMFQPRSAGFFTVHDGKVSVHGRSESLKLDPAENDDVLIARAIGLHPSCN